MIIITFEYKTVKILIAHVFVILQLFYFHSVLEKGKTLVPKPTQVLSQFTV